MRGLIDICASAEKACTQMRRIAVVVIAGLSVLLSASPALAKIPPPWKNCTQVNKAYPHGVGKIGAIDTTSGTPVTNFKRSNALYAKAMSHNRGLDDHDGVVCEKS